MEKYAPVYVEFNSRGHCVEGNDILLANPLKEAGNEINTTGNQTTLVTGKNGSGKTTVIWNYAKKELEGAKTFFFNADEVANRVAEETNNLELLEHYLELLMCSRLYDFMATEDVVLYNAPKARDISEAIIQFYHYSEKSEYLERPKIKVGHLVFPAIEKFKKRIHLDNLNLAIAGFDSGNESTQKAFEKYFLAFEKIVLEVGDKTIVSDEERRQETLKKEYGLVNVSYSDDIEKVKQIMNLRIKTYNLLSESPRKVAEVNKLINEEILNMVIKDANGNLDILINGIKCVAEEVVLRDKKPLSDEISNSFVNGVEKAKLFERNNLTKRLYL